MKVSLFSLLCLFSIYTGFSQNINSETLMSSNTGMLNTFDLSDQSIQGSPYIEDKFVPAKILNYEEDIFNVKYNAVTDEIEVQMSNGVNKTINKNLKNIRILILQSGKIYESIDYMTENGDKIRGYLTKITNNESVNLYKRERKKFVEKKPAKNSYAQAQPAKFINSEEEFYISRQDESAIPLSKKKKEVAEVFPKHKDQIIDYINAERLNIKKQEDLIRLTSYLNELN